MTVLERIRARFTPRADGYGAGWSPGGPPRVLFGSGMDGAPLRYRVRHQAEQLVINGGSWALYRDTDRRLARTARRCDLVYLYRAGATPQVREVISIARARAIPVVYDTDDLNWDERLVEYCDLEQYYAPPDVARFRRMFREAAMLLPEMDALIASTGYLANELRARFDVPVFVHENALARQALALAEPAYLRVADAPPRSTVTLAYFSGWPRAHEPDLAVALPAIRRALDDTPSLRLRIVGHFDIATLPAELRPRVEAAPFVAYERLFDALADVDVNLAPIVANPHRRAKSAVKFLEAALAGVPTIASDLEPYQAIEHGRTGFLASDEQGWYASIMTLAVDAALRRRIGDAARSRVLACDTTSVRAPAFAALLRQIMAERRGAQN